MRATTADALCAGSAAVMSWAGVCDVVSARRPLTTKAGLHGGSLALRHYEEGTPREARAHRTDVTGEVLWRVQPVALGDGEAEILRVAVPSDPKVGQGETVTVDGFPAQAWELDGRSGMAFRCLAVRSA